MRLLDPRFKYVPSARTDISATWRRYGFRPTTDAERRARQRASEDGASSSAHDITLLPERPGGKRHKFGLKLVAE